MYVECDVVLSLPFRQKCIRNMCVPLIVDLTAKLVLLQNMYMRSIAAKLPSSDDMGCMFSVLFNHLLALAAFAFETICCVCLLKELQEST